MATRTLLLIDDRIEDKDFIISSLMPTCDHIVIDFLEDNFDSLQRKLAVFSGTIYNSAGLIQVNYTDKINYMFLKKAQHSSLFNVSSIDPELKTWQNFIMFLQYLKTTFMFSYFDFIECNINDNDWQYVITNLENKVGIIIRASTKVIGELTVGDNWELDTANGRPEITNLISLYFTPNIIEYQHKLDTTINNFCCVTTNGNALSSGSNMQRYANLDVTDSSPAPVFMRNLDNTANLSGVVAISNGYYTTSVLLNDGTVLGCGFNWSGQLGTGTNDYNQQGLLYARNTENTDILKGVVGISTGYSHTIYLLNDSTVVVAGNNYRGEFGNGKDYSFENYSSNIPVFVKDPINNSANLKNVAAICAGFYSSAFLLNDGTLMSCGYNSNGQLGIGSYDNKLYPTFVRNPDNTDILRNVKQVSYSLNTILILLNSGNVLSCGYNYFGLFGIGDVDINENFNLPVYMRNIDDTDILNNVSAISSNRFCSLMLLNDGTVVSCGRNTQGQLGINEEGSSYLPKHVLNADNSILSNVVAINTTRRSSIFLLGDNTLLMCGSNSNGVFGTQRFDLGNTYFTPVSAFNTYQTQPYTGISAVSVSSQSLFFVKDMGQVFDIGYNYSGLLGLGNNDASIAAVSQMRNPSNEGFLGGVSKIVAQNEFVLILMVDGTVMCCGDNSQGEFGNGTYAPSNLPINMLNFADNSNLNNIIDIASGYQHSVALCSDGHVYVCGNNSFGQLGVDSSTENYSTTQYIY